MNSAIELNGSVVDVCSSQEQDWEGRSIKVEKAGEKPKQDRNNRKERFNKKERPQREPREHKEYIDTNKIMVNLLSWGTSSEGLREAFAKFGDIEECLVLTDRQTGKSRGMGIVRFATEESMNKAIEEMNNTVRIVIGQ